MSTIDVKTRLCCLVGNPVEHSLSPAIHNAAFQHAGLNFVYLAFKVDDLEGAMRGVRALPAIRGVSVTIPHKVAVLPHLDKIHPTARNIGAVNTIVSDRGMLTGYNTDASGALAALRAAEALPDGKRVLLLGSGGAARAIAFALCMDTKIADLIILAVLDQERDALIRDLKEKTAGPVSGFQLSPETLKRHIPEIQVLLHCTPVGMSPNIDESCVPRDLMTPPLIVMDIVYNPLETRLLSEARRQGCRTVRGIEMFLHQAVEQFELWTEKPAPVQIMRGILEEHFSREGASPAGKEPGLPGSGHGQGARLGAPGAGG
jgi:shikimate dehydrogenase